MGHLVPMSTRAGSVKHATEEMSMLGRKLPELYKTYRRKEDGITP